MSLESFDFFKSHHNPQSTRARLRWIEWFIAILFLITLLIASGIFIEASNAADVKLKNSKELVLDPHAVIPGTMRNFHEVKSKEQDMSFEMEDDNSCELKP